MLCSRSSRTGAPWVRIVRSHSLMCSDVLFHIYASTTLAYARLQTAILQIPKYNLPPTVRAFPKTVFKLKLVPLERPDALHARHLAIKFYGLFPWHGTALNPLLFVILPQFFRRRRVTFVLMYTPWPLLYIDTDLKLSCRLIFSSVWCMITNQVPLHIALFFFLTYFSSPYFHVFVLFFE